MEEYPLGDDVASSPKSGEPKRDGSIHTLIREVTPQATMSPVPLD